MGSKSCATSKSSNVAIKQHIYWQEHISSAFSPNCWNQGSTALNPPVFNKTLTNKATGATNFQLYFHMLLGRDPNISSMSVKNLSAPRICTIDIARHTDSVRETQHLYNFKYWFDTSSKSYISSLQVNCIKFTDTSHTKSNFHYILKHLNILYIIWISRAGNVKIWISSMGVTLTTLGHMSRWIWAL